MTKVVMIGQISGTRNGENWPEPGESIDVPADEAAQLISGLLARAAAEKEPKLERAVAPRPETATRKGLKTSDI